MPRWAEDGGRRPRLLALGGREGGGRWINGAGEGGLAHEEAVSAIAALASELRGRRARYAVLLCRPSLEGALLALAAFDSGAVLVPLNFRWTVREAVTAVRSVLGRSPFTILVDGDEHCRRIARGVGEQCSSSSRLYARLSDDREAALDVVVEGAPSGPTRRQIDCSLPRSLGLRRPGDGSPSATAAILFTSGTTSRVPKGAGLTHAAFRAQALAKVALLGLRGADTHLHAAPLSHVSGLAALVTSTTSMATNHLFVPKFSGLSYARALVWLESRGDHHGDGRPSVCVLAVPTMLVQLKTHIMDASSSSPPPPPSSGTTVSCFPGVRVGLLGGDAVTDAVAKIATELFPRAKIFSTYGMTEACSSISIRQVNQQGERTTRTRTDLGGHYVGKPCRHVEVALLLGKGEKKAARVAQAPGEVLIRGPSVCSGYITGSKNGGTFVGPGWFRTGDLGWLDGKGGLHLLGRMSQAIRSGGETVFPLEVEREISCCAAPRVRECVVVPVSDAALGQKACALLVLEEKEGAAAEGGRGEVGAMAADSVALLVDHLKRKRGLASYRVPRLFLRSTSALPRNVAGKIERHLVARAVSAHVAALPPQNTKSKL